MAEPHDPSPARNLAADPFRRMVDRADLVERIVRPARGAAVEWPCECAERSAEGVGTTPVVWYRYDAA